MATVTRAYSFLNSIGVCTHLSYTDGGYGNVSNVIKDLKYLGVSNVRDSLQRSSHLAAFEAVAASGARFTLTAPGGVETTASLNATLNLVQSLMSVDPGSVVALEGPDEINHWSVTYNGLGGLAGAIAMQQDLFDDVHDSAAFAGVAVDYFTGYGAGAIANGPNPALVGGLADYDTQHPYPVNGHAPHAYIDPANALTNESGAIGPAVYTETGYSSNGGVSGAVNQDVQAKYTLDLLCDAAKFGVQRTYLYDLLDAYAPGSAQGDDGFGLFDSNNQPKEVAVAIHNLTSLLADPGAAAASFGAGSLKPVVTGLSSVGGSLALEKSTGEYDVLVWDEPEIWNKSTGTEIVARPESVTLDLGATFSHVEVFDPLKGTAAIATLQNVRRLTLQVTDHPLLVEAFTAASWAVAHGA